MVFPSTHPPPFARTRRSGRARRSPSSTGEGEPKKKGGEAPATGDGQLTYEHAVERGFYRRDPGGLEGKFDNVRRYWEDQITRYMLRSFLGDFVQEKQRSLKRMRVLDLGCGAGEGYEILTSIRERSDSLADMEVQVLPRELIGSYVGVDISPAMVKEGRRIYEADPEVCFLEGDLSQGLGDLAREPPFDIYYSSYGSLSHLREEELETLLRDVLAHFGDSFILVADLVGRYSYEWPCYWEGPETDESQMRQYSMSYLYPTGTLDHVEVERFPLRYWGSREFDTLVRRLVDEEGGARVVKRELRDRSVLVGRHMNTGEFNRHAQPIRRAVNELHEFNRRTELETLVFDYTPLGGFPRINEFFEDFQMAWNAVVYAAGDALENWDRPERLEEAPDEFYPEVVRDAIRTIRDVIRHVRWFRMGDPRANVIEPQLGYILRNLEMDLQRGLGAAHSLLAVYWIRRD